jgi:FkbM family methyltransferase
LRQGSDRALYWPRAWARIRHRLGRGAPIALRQRWWASRRILSSVTIVSDVASFRAYWRLHTAAPLPEVVALRLRPLSGERVLLRPETSDAQVVYDTFSGAYHLPPAELDSGNLVRIWDLGSNIGLTMAHMAVLYRRAQIVGVELDRENAHLCRLNTTAWADRCTVREAAVWTTDGRVSYRLVSGQEYGASVMVDASAKDGGLHEVEALSLNSLLAEEGDDSRVDYVKMDIEGAESEVLRRHIEWADRVRSIKVEVHPPYSVEDCMRDLRTLGFEVRADRHHFACVEGVRRAGGPHDRDSGSVDFSRGLAG